MSFQQGLSGLNSSSKALDVVGNNIANSSTVGFKAATVHFADVFANSLAGSGTAQVGIGTATSAIQQNFTQGNITRTNNPLDIAISGSGFYQMSSNGTLTYSRNGLFHVDNSGFIVDDAERNLTGYLVRNGVIDRSQAQPLQLSSANINPVATGDVFGVRASLNLDSRSIAPTTTFDQADPTSYNFSTATTIYDSLGNAHSMTLFARKSTALPAGAGVAAAAATAAGSAAATYRSAASTYQTAADALVAGTGTAANALTAAQAANVAATALVTAANAAVAAATPQTSAAAIAAQGAANAAKIDADAALAAATAAAAVGAPPATAVAAQALATTAVTSANVANTAATTTIAAATASNWDIYTSIDGTSVDNVNAGVPITVSFNSSGILVNAPGQGTPLAIDLNAVMLAQGQTNNASALNFNLDFAGTTQFGNASGTNSLDQDGFTTGRLTGISVGADGTIQGNYSNGKSTALGQVVLASFTNPNGLASLGGNQWAATSASNAAQLGAPNTGTLGVLQAAAMEESNTDLTAELVNMITQQRNYQANAQTIKAQDQIMQTLVNLR